MMGPKLAAQLGISGRACCGGNFGDIYIDDSLSAADRKRDARRGGRRLSSPSAGRGSIHRRRDRRDSSADQPARQAEPDRARSRKLLSGPVGRLLCGAQEETSRRSPTPATASSRPTAARGITTAGCRSCSGAEVSAARRSQVPAETVDIMPTLAALIELPVAAGSVDGRCLEGTPAFCPQLSA